MILYKKDVIDKLSEKTGLYKKDIKAMLILLYVRSGRIIVISSYGMNNTLLRYECLMKHLN